MNKTLDAKPRPGRGRRPGGADTREVVLDVARRRFLADGYQAVSLRSIATEAGVDVALLSYFFGSKQGLFAAALRLPTNPAVAIAEALPGDVAGVPERLLRKMLTVWDDRANSAPLRAMLGVAGEDPDITRLLRELVERELIAPLAKLVGGRDAHKRAGMAAALLSGVVFSRYVLEAEPMASATVDEVVGYLAPALASVLQPPARVARRTSR